MQHMDPKGPRINHDFRSYSRSAIVYIFIHISSGASYIGSSMSPLARVQEHGQMAKNLKYLKHPFYSLVIQEGWGAFTSGVLQISTQFVNEFKFKYPDMILTDMEIRFLNTATTYELLMKEQSFISMSKPSLNINTEVTSVLVRPANSTGRAWVSGGVTKREVILYIESDTSLFNVEVIRYKSINNASQALGVSREKIRRAAVLNETVYVESMSLTVKFKIESTNAISYTILKLPDTLINQIPVGYVAAVNTDLNSIFGVYSSINNAADQHLISRKNISRYTNSTRLIKTSLGSFYFYIHSKI